MKEQSEALEREAAPIRRYTVVAAITVGGFLQVDVSAASAEEARAAVGDLIVQHGGLRLEIDRRQKEVFVRGVEIDDSELEVEDADASEVEEADE